MSTEEKPSYEELERRNDSLARQVISYQMRVNESLSSIIRNAKAEALEEAAADMQKRSQAGNMIIRDAGIMQNEASILRIDAQRIRRAR